MISQVLYNYGYIDAFGTGFDRTFSLCTKQNINYKYINDEFGFTFIFLRELRLLNDKINDKINDLDKEIVQIIKENKYVTIPELSSIIGKTSQTIYRHLKHLIEIGKIKRVGSRKNGYWKSLI